MFSNVTNAYKAKIAENSRTFKAKFVNVSNSADVISDNIISAQLSNQSIADTASFSIGGTVSATLEAQIFGVNSSITGKEYEYQVGLVMENGSIEYVPMGLFTVQKPTIADGLATFTAYDRFVSKLGYLYNSVLTYPTDSKNILTEIQTMSGVTIVGIDSLGTVSVPARIDSTEDDEGNITETLSAPFAGFSYREAIGYIAMMHGCFATINRSGAVELRKYVSADFTVPTSRSYSNLVKAETSYAVQYLKLNVGNGETSYTSGATGTGVNVECPTGSQEIADYAFSMISNLSFYPATVSFLGDPRLDLGDIVTVTAREGGTVSVPIMAVSHTYDGGLTSGIGSYGGTQSSEETLLTSPTANKLDRQYAELAMIKTLVAGKASIKKLEAEYATIESLNAEIARIDTLEATEINVDFLNANYVKSDAASIGTLFSDIGILTNVTIEDGHITGYLDAVNVDAANITAGTLSVDRLVIRGNEQSLVYELNNVTGALQSQNVNTLNGEVLTPRTINADRIVAESITSNEIAAETITANNVATGTLTGDKIAANTITGDNIEVYSIDASRLQTTGNGNNIIPNGIDYAAWRVAVRDSSKDYIVEDDDVMFETTGSSSTKLMFHTVWEDSTKPEFQFNISDVILRTATSYMLSFYVKSDCDVKIDKIEIGTAVFQFNTSVIKSGEWTRLFAKIKAGSNILCSGTMNVYASIINNQLTTKAGDTLLTKAGDELLFSGGNCWVNGFQLEKVEDTVIAPTAWALAELSAMLGASIRTNTLYSNSYVGDSITGTKFDLDSGTVYCQNWNIVQGNGTFSGNLYAKSFVTTSDMREKNDIEDLPDKLLELVSKIRVILFKWPGNNQKQVGVIAQEIIQAFTDLRLDWRNYGIIEEHFNREKWQNRYSVNYTELEMLNLKATQVLMDRVVKLEREVAELNGKENN